MPFKWSENVTLKFLEEYKKHECLWNPNSTQYYNCCAKKEAIRTIINTLSIPTLTETECQRQIETITKKYEQEQSKTLDGLCSGKPYKSKLPWYPLIQDMLTETLNNEKNDTIKVTICSNSIPDKKKKSQISKKKKKPNVSSPAPEIITYDSCGHKIIRKPAPKPLFSEKIKHPKRKLQKKNMTEKYTNYVQCSNFGTSNSSLQNLDDKRYNENNRDQISSPRESICVREIKKRRDIPRINTFDAKSEECSSCCRQNSENNHYAAKDNYSLSKNIISCPNYYNKPNNSNLNYNDFRYKDSNDQHRCRTRFIPCPDSLKSSDQLFSTCQNRYSYNYSKHLDNYSAPERNICTNNFEKNVELHTRPNKGLSFIPEVNDKNYCPTSEDQGVMQFIPRVATKFENGVLEAYSQFKISIQCCENNQGNKTLNVKTCQGTQTSLERKEQTIRTYETKETQHEGIKSQSKQTGMDIEDSNTNIQNNVCVSCVQTDQMKDNMSDYILLMPGRKCVRLAKTICSKENFVQCQGVSESRYDDEALSVSTETSCMTQESKLVDCDTMTTPQLMERVDEILKMNSNSQEIEILNSVSPSRSENREIEGEGSECEACKGSEMIDDDFKFCFKKFFNKEISSSDCFPCLKEKIDKTSDLTKTFLCILKYVLDQDCKAENNTKDSRFKSQGRKEMINKICKCVKKLSEVRSKNYSKEVAIEKEKSISRSVNTISKNVGISKQTGTGNKPSISRSVNTIKNNIGVTKLIGTETEPSISRGVNAISKNVGIAKQVETEERPLISRSMNTFMEEIPVEIIQVHFENQEINTDFSADQKEAGTNPMEKIKSQNASTQVKARLSGKSINKEKNVESEYEEFKRNECKRVCFENMNEAPKIEYLCEKNCKGVNYNLAKVRLAEKNSYKIKRKMLEKTLSEAPKIRSIANRKIFFSDFCI